MKSRTKNRFFTPILAFLLVFFSGCAGGERDWLSYRTEPLAVRLEGNRCGRDFSCELFCTEGRLSSLSYISPDSLKGICITPAAEGRYKIEQGGLSHEVSQETLSGGLLLPAELLLLQDVSLLSVQRMADGMLLTLSSPHVEGEITLSLDAAGSPQVVSSKDLTLRVLPILGDR